MSKKAHSHDKDDNDNEKFLYQKQSEKVDDHHGQHDYHENNRKRLMIMLFRRICRLHREWQLLTLLDLDFNDHDHHVCCDHHYDDDGDDHNHGSDHQEMAQSAA